MKLKSTKKIYNLLATLLVTAGMLSSGYTASAQSCVDYVEQNNGNLLGYIVASDLPSDDQENYIWVNSKDDPWDGGPSYGVSYDSDTGVFSGRGWNEGLRVWVDFDYGTTDEAQVLDSDGDPVGGFKWGYWDGEVRGVDNLTYSNNQGGFTPLGSEDVDVDGDGAPDFTYTWPYDAQYVSGGSSDDVLVGMGELSFDQVVFDISSIPSECQEYVDIVADGRSSLDIGSCGESVELTWSSQNVEAGTCVTVDSGAPWVSQGARSETNLSGENSDAVEISPALFTLECIGSISGNTVVGRARVSCGDDPSAGTGGTSGASTGNNFEFIES